MIEAHGAGGCRTANLICDNCGWSPPVGFGDFREATTWARDHSWKLRKEHGQWENICPHCARELGLLPPDPMQMEDERVGGEYYEI